LTYVGLRWHGVVTMAPTRPLEAFLQAPRIDRLRRDAGIRTRSLTVVLDGVHDPHNLSAVVRSCEGFGLLDLWVIESHARFRVNTRVSQGAEKWLDIHRHDDPAACAQALREKGFELWVADPGATGVDIGSLSWENKIALVFGNEHEGVSPQMERAASGRFCIPMHGFSQSLNVSVAVGIGLAIGVRERQRRLGRLGDLTASEQAELVAEWERRSVRYADRILAYLENRREESRDAQI
jgi:tRNA (guanosine-2'-O-)-methyltransferase